MSLAIEKVCPVLLRDLGGAIALLAFRHPLAGTQLVKGTREPGEDIAAAALRELREEAGLSARLDDSPIWTSNAIVSGQLWHFVPVTVAGVPDQFKFWTQDDGGHWFSFFFFPLGQKPDESWHEMFVRALSEIRAHLPM